MLERRAPCNCERFSRCQVCQSNAWTGMSSFPLVFCKIATISKPKLKHAMQLPSITNALHHSITLQLRHHLGIETLEKQCRALLWPAPLDTLGKDLRSRVLDHHKDVYYRVRLANFSLQSTSILTLVTNHSFLTQRHKTTPPISILPLTTPFSLSSRRLLICTPPTRETSAAKSALF